MHWRKQQQCVECFQNQLRALLTKISLGRDSKRKARRTARASTRHSTQLRQAMTCEVDIIKLRCCDSACEKLQKLLAASARASASHSAMTSLTPMDYPPEIQPEPLISVKICRKIWTIGFYLFLLHTSSPVCVFVQDPCTKGRLQTYHTPIQ